MHISLSQEYSCIPHSWCWAEHTMTDSVLSFIKFNVIIHLTVIYTEVNMSVYSNWHWNWHFEINVNKMGMQIVKIYYLLLPCGTAHCLQAGHSPLYLCHRWYCHPESDCSPPRRESEVFVPLYEQKKSYRLIITKHFNCCHPSSYYSQ